MNLATKSGDFTGYAETVSSYPMSTMNGHISNLTSENELVDGAPGKIPAFPCKFKGEIRTIYKERALGMPRTRWLGPGMPYTLTTKRIDEGL